MVHKLEPLKGKIFGDEKRIPAEKISAILYRPSMRHRSFVKPLENVYNKILRNEKLVRVFVPLVKSMALELGDGCLMVVFFCYFVKKGNF